MSSPRIAMLLNEPPLPHFSAASRSYFAMLREFIARDADVDVMATLNNAPELLSDLQKTYPAFHQRIHLFPSGHPNRLLGKIRTLRYPLSFQAGSAMRRELGKRARNGQYDIYHLEMAWMAYAIGPEIDPNRVLLNLHYLLETDFQGHVKPADLRERFERSRVLSWEQSLIRRFRHIRVLSESMADKLHEIHPGCDVHVIPLPIDADSYAFQEHAVTTSEPVVTMIGSMFWPPSRDAAERILTRLWPSIIAEVPAAKIQIVGRDARRHFGNFDGQQRVSVIENVPEITPYFHGADVLLYAPSAGSGMKVKVQEAMLLGLAVVTNQSGAEGLNPRNEHDVMLAESDEELIRATVRLLRDGELRRRLSLNARKLVERCCSPAHVVDRLMEVYSDMIKQSRPGRTMS